MLDHPPPGDQHSTTTSTDASPVSPAVLRATAAWVLAGAAIGFLAGIWVLLALRVEGLPAPLTLGCFALGGAVLAVIARSWPAEAPKGGVAVIRVIVAFAVAGTAAALLAAVMGAIPLSQVWLGAVFAQFIPLSMFFELWGDSQRSRPTSWRRVSILLLVALAGIGIALFLLS